jgi:hypothetical protein
MEESQGNNSPNSASPRDVRYVQAPPSNGVGVAGFVLAILSIFFGWVPVLGWLMWLLGLILSFIGIFKAPRGLAIAGLIISLLGLIFLLLVFGAIGAAIAMS